MTLTATDIGQILIKCAGYRPDRTPQRSELVLMAWMEHFDDFPHITAEDALEAVRVYHRDPHDHMIQPADISKIAREIRRDRAEREDREMLEARQAALDARLTAAIDEIGQATAIPPRFKRASQRGENQPNPLSVRCPWCYAGEFRACQIPGTTQAMRNVHPSRVELAERGVRA